MTCNPSSWNEKYCVEKMTVGSIEKEVETPKLEVGRSDFIRFSCEEVPRKEGEL